MALHDHRIRFLRRPENEKTDMHFAGIIERNRRDVNNNSSVGGNLAERRSRGYVLGDHSFPSNLNSIQNFGAVDVLCTDKTGTLTQGKIVLVKHLDVDGNEIFKTKLTS
ncbi:MAG: hypothetical protein KJ814_11470 [Proteobacteria bacterium]|nr:hypothetical protein [Pseudomonadota bacterium]